MKKVLTGIFIFSFLSSQAQKSPLYVKADFGLSNIKSNGGKPSISFGYGIGVETFVKAGQYFVINPALALRKTGYGTLSDKVAVNYLAIDLPLMFNVDGVFLDSKSNDAGFIVGAGPYVGYAVSGNFTVNDVKKNMSFGNGIADNRKSIDAGLVLKSGIRLNKIFIGSQYNIGFVNLIPKDRVSNGSSIKSRNFLFYLSFPIGGRKK